jgi:hypothetical protein
MHQHSPWLSEKLEDASISLGSIIINTANVRVVPGIKDSSHKSKNFADTPTNRPQSQEGGRDEEDTKPAVKLHSRCFATASDYNYGLANIKSLTCPVKTSTSNFPSRTLLRRDPAAICDNILHALSLSNMAEDGTS